MTLPDGERVARIATETPSDGGPDAVVATCAEALLRVQASALPGVGHPLGVGISAPGPVDPWAGVILEPPNLGRQFENVPIAAAMEAGVGLPAYL